MRVLIWHDRVPEGAPPDQQDVFDQVAVITRAMAGHDVRVAAFDGTVDDVLRDRPDVVVNLVESVDGDGKLLHLPVAALEVLGVPFTGASSAALVVSTHKELARRVMSARGVSVPDGWSDRSPAGTRFIVKSRWEHASIGIDDDNVVDARDVPAAIERLSPRLGGAVVVEQYIHGRELNVSMLDRGDGLVALPVAEIVFDLPADRPHIIGYAAKWEEGSDAWRATPRSFDVAPELAARAQRVALAAAAAVGVTGYARVDLRVAADGALYVLEVNANPCLSPDAGFAAALERAGLDLYAEVRGLVARAARRAAC